MDIALRRISCLLDDAKGVLRAGVDYIAHSVRDREVDDEFIRLMKKRTFFTLLP